ncbi:MAG: hypothetical protein QOG93_411, partial [Gaiellaceae bacterium]|nr:hypothetical protein [Gaiellaceae bacterium]
MVPLKKLSPKVHCGREDERG